MFRYIGRHWRGELSLPQSYWVNGVLLGLPLNIYFRVLGEAFQEQPPQSPAIYLSLFLIPFVLAQPLYIWQGVGIWRSAEKRIADDRPGWAWVARIVILFNAAVLLYNIAEYGPAQYSAVRAYMTERESSYTVKDHGRYVVFHGTITQASAEALEPLLKAPAVQRLVIDGSNGGFILPTLRLTKIIHDRKLMVVAIGGCYSSCTGLVAAGDKRAFAPDTVAGFHIGTLVGLDQTAAEWDDVESYYRADGMKQSMLDEIHAHRGPQDFYYPTMRELIDNGFLTEMYNPDIHLYEPAREWCDKHARQCDMTGKQIRDAAKPK